MQGFWRILWEGTEISRHSWHPKSSQGFEGNRLAEQILQIRRVPCARIQKLARQPHYRSRLQFQLGSQSLDVMVRKAYRNVSREGPLTLGRASAEDLSKQECMDPNSHTQCGLQVHARKGYKCNPPQKSQTEPLEGIWLEDVPELGP